MSAVQAEVPAKPMRLRADLNKAYEMILAPKSKSNI